MKVKNIIVTVSFLLILFGGMLINLILPDEMYSNSERRKLQQRPSYSYEALMNGSLFEEFENYSLDQFAFRDFFRKIKAMSNYYVFGQKDNNDIYIIDGNINKLDYPLNEKAVSYVVDKINTLYKTYLEGKDVSFAIIPDKNYFLAKKHGYLALDYEKMEAIMKESLIELTYINLFDQLTIDDYYRTDLHWRQEKIIKLADHILAEMGNVEKASEGEYTINKYQPFYGSYYGQSALELKADTLVYLTSDFIEKAVVTDYEEKKQIDLYQVNQLGGMDSYDVFLAGAKALITIESPENKSGKELILFRDSFGSSIAPLLLTSYAKITLVDLRYISTELLENYIDFTKNSDVLFLYNTQVLNHGYMLK